MDLKRVLVFDMDGVLVDVSESYRETIRQTVLHFTGQDVTPEQIQAYKNRGGFNNDWLLTQQMAADLGVTVPYDTVVEEFQRRFFGAERDGLILRERWLPRPGLLEGLAENHPLGIFTGRLRYEVEFTLGRFASGVQWSNIVADDDVVKPKPAPDGLLSIQELHPAAKLLYFGDTVDDARSAAAAGVEFVGIVHAHTPDREQSTALLRAEGAVAVLNSINEIESTL